jgi:hypothetical protein
MNQINKNVYLTTFFLTLIVFLITFFSGENHDYESYLVSWNYFILGSNPWANEFNDVSILSSAYGPLHSIIGYLTLISSFLPKIFFSFCSIVIFYYLTELAKKQKKILNYQDFFFILLIYPLFPLTIINVYLFGINDSLIALLIIFACESRKKENFLFTGFFLGFGALIKFYPILFLPFFALCNKKGISLKCLATGISVFLIGMFFSYIIWGNEILNPLFFGADRDPKLLSILKFLDYLNTPSSVGLFNNLINFLISKNSFFLLLIVFFIFLHGLLAKIEWEYVALIGILLLLASYKVGHPQFYLSWSALLAWVMLSSNKNSEKRSFTLRLIPVLVYLGLFQCIYLISGFGGSSGYLSDDWEFIRNICSVPFLIIILICLYLNKSFFKKKWKSKIAFFW